MDYSSPHAVCSDAFSAVALDVADSDALGVKSVLLKGLFEASGRPLFAPFLRLFVFGDLGWEPVRLVARADHPVGWRATGECSAGLVTEEVHFAHGAHIRARWQTPSGRALRFALLGAGGGEGVQLSGAVQDRSLAVSFVREFRTFLPQLHGDTRQAVHGEVMLVTDQFPVRAGWFAPAGLGTCPPADGLTLAVDALSAPGHAYWLEFAPASETVLDTAWSFSGPALESLPGVVPPRADSAPLTLDEAARDWEKRHLARPPEPALDRPYWRGHLARAQATILGSAVCAPGYGNFAADLGIPAGAKGWASTAFFWDHFMAATVLGATEPAWQTSAVRFFLRHCSGGRIAPGILFTQPLYGLGDKFQDCYAPIVSWSLLQTWRASGRRPELEVVYPLLRALHEGWLRDCDRDGDGIPEWRNTGNPADNSPLYDRYAPEPGKYNFNIPPFVSVNLCSYLLMDARCLARFARELGLSADAAAWDARGDHYEKVLLERCWDPAAGFFFDLTPEGARNPVRTFFGFLPLWAGARLPAADIKRLIEGQLLAPAAFFGRIPFPSVAYDEPAYDPKGYWRGRTWPHVYFWLTQTLHQHGYAAEAEQARERFLAMVAYHPQPMENYPGDPSALHLPGETHYIWGASAVAHFLWGWHRQPVLAA